MIEDKLEDFDANKFHHIYTLETKDGVIVANAHLEEKEYGVEITQIGADKKTYGLAGRSLIAQMAKDVLKDKPDGKLIAFAPNPDAIRFYTMNCNFNYDKDYNLGINKKEIDNLYDNLII